MRGHEALQEVFDRLIAFKGAEVQVVQLQNGPSEVAMLPEDQAIVAFLRYKSRVTGYDFNTTYASLMVWSYLFTESSKPEDVMASLPTVLPLLHMKGGPLPGIEWQEGRGRSFPEAIIGEYQFTIRHFSASWPFLCLIGKVAEIARDVMDEQEGKLPTFWEKTYNPHHKY